MSILLKDDLISLKSKLENIETQLEGQMKDLENREEKWNKMDSQVKEIIEKQNNVVRLNVGGKKFATYTQTLLNIQDTLFYKLVLSKKLDLSKEVFFDRSPKIFSPILDYLRYKTINYKKFSKVELDELRIEADYYELAEISAYLEEQMKEIEFVAMTNSAPYTTAGSTNRLEDLKDRNLGTGICLTGPGWLTIELNNEWDIEEVEVGGYTGNPNGWYSGNGANSTIQTSKDNITWTTVGTVPATYANAIVPIRVTKSSGKYLKFTNSAYMEFGFIGIKKPS